MELLGGLVPDQGVEEEHTWVDPVIGARGLTALSERWVLSGYADIGGFGVSSDLTWQGYGGVTYALNDAIAASVGYRYLAEDFEDDGFVQDLALHGPLIGVSFRR